MTTVSMDRTSAKFTPTSFSWGGSHIYCMRAMAQPRIGHDLSPDRMAGACRGDSQAR